MPYRQRPQQKCVKRAENRRVRPDAESECDNGNEGKAGRLAKLSKSKAEVVHEIVEFRMTNVE